MTVFLVRIHGLGRFALACVLAAVGWEIVNAALDGRHQSITPWAAGIAAGLVWRQLDRAARRAPQ